MGLLGLKLLGGERKASFIYSVLIMFYLCSVFHVIDLTIK